MNVNTWHPIVRTAVRVATGLAALTGLTLAAGAAVAAARVALDLHGDLSDQIDELTDRVRQVENEVGALQGLEHVYAADVHPEPGHPARRTR